MTIQTKLLIISVLISSFFIKAQNTDFYISAHPDDWQLFMNPNAYKSVKIPGNKVVFIHTTAGDAGLGMDGNYYLARQEGSLRAIRFISNAQTNGLGINMNKTRVSINGHDLLKFSYRNIVIYFFNLPDGGVGEGYPATGSISLKKLYNVPSSGIKAIDGSATYSSLEDLKLTIRNIIKNESQSNSIAFHIADTNETNNPGDHTDHLYSSKIIQDVSQTFTDKVIKLNLYINYHSGTLGSNLSGDDYLINIATWGVTDSGITDSRYSSKWDNEHNTWLGKQYFRTVN